MKRRLLLLSSLLGTALAARGQYAVSGKVLDKQTRQPIPYASVVVAGTAQGTTSNADGEFTLLVKQAAVKLLASSLGYGRDSVLVVAAGAAPVLALPAVPVQLPAVERPSYVAELVAKAYQELQRTSGHRAYGQAFYRQVTRIDNNPTEVQEAVWEVRTSNAGLDGSVLTQGRYAAKPALMNFNNFSTYTKLFGKIWAGQGLDSAASHALVSPHTARDYTLRLKGLTQDGRRNLAEIAFERKPVADAKTPAFRGSLFIDTDTYQILHVQGELPMQASSNKRAYAPKDAKLAFDLELKPQPTGATPVYLKVTSGMYLSQPRKPDANVQATSFTYFYNAQPTPTGLAYATDGQANDLAAIKKQAYDPTFWRDNPVVKRTPLEEEIIRSFEQQKSFGTMLAK